LGKRPELVFIPSDDVALIAHVASLVDAPDSADWMARLDHAELERQLRKQFPRATVRPRDPLAQVHPDDPPVWYVSRGRERFRLRATEWIAAPRAAVFEAYVDPTRVASWQGVARTKVLERSPRVVGTAWEAEYEVFRIRIGGTFRIVDAEVPSRVRVEAAGPLRVRLWYLTRFEERDGGTIVDVQGDYELPFELLNRVPSRLVVEREIERMVARAHTRLKAICEAAGPRTKPAAAKP
jgi:uncharacterized protein YndB with AHSA1/START domain